MARSKRSVVLGLLLASTVSARAATDNPPYTSAGMSGGTVVAVIDSGVDYTHPLIAGQSANRSGYRGWDFKAPDAFPFDFMPPRPTAPTCNPFRNGLGCVGDHLEHAGRVIVNLLVPGAAGHGTHVAGIALKAGGPRVSVLPMRIDYGATSATWINQVVQATHDAIVSGARVVNMSFGIYENTMDTATKAGMEDLRRLMEAAEDVVFVIAAGNENNDLLLEGKRIYPGSINLPNVLTVGAVDSSGELAPFSNTGYRFVDVYAPGVDIESTWPGGGLRVASGTSMATPFVAGAVARLIDADPSLNGRQARSALIDRTELKIHVFEKTENPSRVLSIGAKVPLVSRVLMSAS